MSESKKNVGAESVATTFQDCPAWGSGGRFSYDPLTKTRTRLVEVEEEPATPSKTKALAAPADATKKEKDNG